MKIGTREIGYGHAPLVIAEIGINHGGSLDVAKEMVRLAAASGCECVKHQTHIIEDEMTDEAKQIFPPNADVSIWEVMANCALSLDDEIALKDYTESLGMIYISTPFSRAAADFLNEIDVPAFKIGSGEVDNLPLIRHIARFGKPVIMTRNPCIDLDIENLGIGTWVDPYDVDGWTRAIKWHFENIEQSNRMGLKAKALGKRLSAESFGKKINSLIIEHYQDWKFN